MRDYRWEGGGWGKKIYFFILYFLVWFEYLTTCMYYFLFEINFLI